MIPFKFSVVVEVCDVQVAPSSDDVKTDPDCPTATNSPRLSEYTTSLKLSLPVLVSTQLLPFTLVKIVPLSPTITIMLLPLVTPYIVSAEPDGVTLFHTVPLTLRNTTD